MSDRYLYPRPEYPRPDRQRGFTEGYDWLNLNGAWQFRFDGARRGLEEHWFAPGGPDWREQIIVPFCWESLAAWGEGENASNDNYYSTRVFRNPLSVTRENHRSAARYEVGWYRRRITIPSTAPWVGKRVILNIGAADFYTECWGNGVYLGRHEGGYTPFEFDLTDALTASDAGQEGWVVFRVEDPMENAEQPVGKQWRWYTTTSGIWQTVWIEPRSSVFIRDFTVTGDIDKGTATVAVHCANAEPGSELHMMIRAPAGEEEHLTLQVSDQRASECVKLKRLFLWDPNEPHLYVLGLTLLRNGIELDSVCSFFGMRRIDFQIAAGAEAPTALRINNSPRYLRGALYQSYFPDGVYTAGSVETYKQDILHAKRFGFNFLRIHIKVDDPLLLHWADRLGILLMADLPNFGEGGDTPLGRQRFEIMMRESIARDYNHPSIIAWCLFNETWGFGGQTGLLRHILEYSGKPFTGVLPEVPAERKRFPGAHPGMSSPQVWVQQMWELAKKLDPTRLIEDMSVCQWEHLEYYQHCDTDINSWHFYEDDYEKAKAHIDRVASSTFVGSSYNYVPGFHHKGQPLINSEYGGVGALDGDRDVSWSFKFLTNELRRHPQIAAYIYTELHDVEWEYNGFLNYDRTPKEFGYDPRIVNESNTLPVDAAPVQKVSPGSLVVVPVDSSHYSRQRVENVTLRWALAGVDAQGNYHQNLQSGSARIPFPHLVVAPATRLELHMPQQSMLCTLYVTAHTAKGDLVASNFVHFYVSDRYPPEREEVDRGLLLRGFPGAWARAEWSDGPVDREKHRVEDCCNGVGSGFFEWDLPLHGAELARARRIRVLCEASSHRTDSPQTDGDAYPSSFFMSLGGVPLMRCTLNNHPHDARGVLSYWRGGLGGYGYLLRAVAEDAMLQEIAAQGRESLVLRCEVPASAFVQGGLSVYGAECGRFPLSPTVLIEW